MQIVEYEDIYAGEDGIEGYFDDPCQVIYIDEGHLEFLKENFDVVTKEFLDTHPCSLPTKEDGSYDYIKICQLTGNYSHGIAYCEEIISTFDGSVTWFKYVHFIRAFSTWKTLKPKEY